MNEKKYPTYLDILGLKIVTEKMVEVHSEGNPRSSYPEVSARSLDHIVGTSEDDRKIVEVISEIDVVTTKQGEMEGMLFFGLNCSLHAPLLHEGICIASRFWCFVRITLYMVRGLRYGIKN